MLVSNIFGLTEQSALFSIAFPGMTPPQVETALKEIDNSAQYLRFSQGRYYASLEPSVNRALTSIRGGLKKEQVDELLILTARKIVKGSHRATPALGFGLSIVTSVILRSPINDWHRLESRRHF